LGPSRCTAKGGGKRPQGRPEDETVYAQKVSTTLCVERIRRQNPKLKMRSGKSEGCTVPGGIKRKKKDLKRDLKGSCQGEGQDHAVREESSSPAKRTFNRGSFKYRGPQ